MWAWNRVFGCGATLKSSISTVEHWQLSVGCYVIAQQPTDRGDSLDLLNTVPKTDGRGHVRWFHGNVTP